MADLISRTEAAAMAGVSYDTLKKSWEKKPETGWPRPVAWVGRRIFYNRADVLHWLDERTTRSKPRSAPKLILDHAEA